jgi:hypothetical protein
MTTKAPSPDRDAATPAPQGGGWLSRIFGTLIKSLIDAVLSHIWGALILALSPLLGYVALWQTDLVPGPREILANMTPSPPPAVVPARSSGIAEVEAQGEGLSGDKARAIQIRVTGSLRAMPESFGGVRVRFALGPIRSANGAASATSVRWALASGASEWLVCPAVPVTFTSERGLADDVAKRINNSLLASERGGKLQCG